VTLTTWILLACGSRAPESPPAAEESVLPPLVQPSQGLGADLAAAEAFSATRPIYERPLGVGTKLPDAVGSLSAEVCGACHPEIQAEWQLSTHALAWVDAQFQAEITKSGNRWLCLNCHTPLRVQQDYWAVGLQGEDVESPVLVEAPSYDPALREQGITCAACHVRDGVVHGPGLPDSTSPHPVAADEDFQGDGICTRCHQAVAMYPGKQFICTFDTGKEWAAGPYAAEGRGCKDCHMPRVDRPAAVGGPVRSVARHWWRGAGIPKLAGVQPPLEANPPGLDVEATWGTEALSLRLTNARAGHLLPTGDPERRVRVEVQALDAQGSVLAEAWSVQFGQAWEWWPTPRKLSDDRLAPRESRSYQVPLPAGTVSARVLATSSRLTEETAAYHALDGYPREVRTHELLVTAGGVTGGLLGDPP